MTGIYVDWLGILGGTSDYWCLGSCSFKVCTAHLAAGESVHSLKLNREPGRSCCFHVCIVAYVYAVKVERHWKSLSIIFRTITCVFRQMFNFVESQ
jgi:hypothetical protein